MLQGTNHLEFKCEVIKITVFQLRSSAAVTTTNDQSCPVFKASQFSGGPEVLY